MFKRGNRLFTAGALSMILVAALHTLGHFSTPPEDPELAAVLRVMNGYQFDLGIGHPTVMEIHKSLSLTMTLLLLTLAGVDLAVLALVPEEAALLRVLQIINLLGITSLVVLFVVYPVPPPMISFAVVGMLFLLSLILPKRKP